MSRARAAVGVAAFTVVLAGGAGQDEARVATTVPARPVASVQAETTLAVPEQPVPAEDLPEDGGLSSIDLDLPRAADLGPLRIEVSLGVLSASHPYTGKRADSAERYLGLTITATHAASGPPVEVDGAMFQLEDPTGAPASDGIDGDAALVVEPGTDRTATFWFVVEAAGEHSDLLLRARGPSGEAVALRLPPGY